MDDNADKNNRTSRLTKFCNKIGGHSNMLQYDDSTICKTLIPRELFIYRSCPSQLRQFIPDFRGIIRVRVKEDDKGLTILNAYRITENDLSAEELDYTKEYFMPYGEVDSGHETCNYQDAKNRGKRSGNDEIASFEDESYILLENISSKFGYPFILDLKMGSRQHGDTASISKKRRQEAKSAATTSCSLGVRFFAMQTYDVEGKLHRYDKFYGRSLNDSDFAQAFYKYLCGRYNQLQLRVCLGFIEKLKCMRKVIMNQNGYRFYACSLLLVYDGQFKDIDMELKYNDVVDARLIDFAHTTCDDICKGSSMIHNGPDNGLLKGLQTIIDLLSDFSGRHGSQ